MISVVCVYNHKDILNECLIKSLEFQNFDYELILVDNSELKFKSASEALNNAVRNAKGKYIIFAHQDVYLKSEDSLKNTVKLLNSLKNLGVAGVAGKKINKKDIISNITAGGPPEKVGISFETPLKVQTVDECLFIIPKSMFNINCFDEKVCDGWHFYAVDYCLSVMEMGFNIYLIPLELYHKSIGYSFTTEYYSILKKLIKKHGKYYNTINTTTENWNTRLPLFLQINFKRVIWLTILIKKRILGYKS
jgi:GT2 family glycosyltransferase